MAKSHQADLFGAGKNSDIYREVGEIPPLKQQPLAERMRPRKLDQILGQDHILGPQAALGRILAGNSNPIPSFLLFGPPGTGKTTIATVIANESNYRFVRLSGVLDGVAELRTVVEDAKRALRESGRPTLALVDEIHRFNKTQQDAFLPHLESGLLTVIGQTTENVSFRIRNAMLSRMRVIEVKLLSEEVLSTLISQALTDTERGLGNLRLTISQDALRLLSKLSMGDARRALTGLEWASATTSAKGSSVIERTEIESSFGNQPYYFDADGDYHYNCISAFIKSMRGSDPDAALYYMTRALAGGEDPLFITRRMLIFASEDAGCDPRALEIAIHVDRAVERLGLPECKIPMAQGVVYLASCLKSNASYRALGEAEKLVAEYPDVPIPKHLRNAPTDLMREFGNSLGYKYPHDYPNALVPERYLPEEIGEREFYQPSDRGLEAQIKERLAFYRFHKEK